MPRPLPDIKSPCWWSNRNHDNKCTVNGYLYLFRRPMTLRRMDTPKYERARFFRCLPYVYLIGQAKCGTSDIFHKITQHPEIDRPDVKEPFWIMPIRYQKECSSLDAYHDAYKQLANRIQTEYTETGRSVLITIDASTTTMSGNTWWSLLPGNEGCREPCTTNPDIVHHLNPAAKILVSLRNPTARTFSFYLAKSITMKYNASLEHFNKIVENEIAEFKQCQQTSPLLECVFNTSQENYLTTGIGLRSSIYYIHLQNWRRVFPRDQIHVVHFEYYTKHVAQTLSDIYRFLDVGELSMEELQSIANQAPRNTKEKHLKQLGNMWPKTKTLLDTFFKPFNERLSLLLSDEKFKWK